MPRRGAHLLTSAACLLLQLIVSANAGDDDEAGTDWWDLGQRIKKQILKNYDVTAMPHRDHNGTTTIYYTFVPTAIWMHDDTQILSVNAYVPIYWRDERLKWNHEDFGGMKHIYLSPDDVWKPDVYVYNNAKIKETDNFGYYPVGVHYTGSLFWVPAAELDVECPQDLTHWPYDKQECVIVFGSWTKDGWQLNLESWFGRNKSSVDLQWYLKTNHHWRVEEATIERVEKYYPCCEEPYVSLNINIALARDSPSFVFTVILPGLGIALLTLIQFVLPFGSSKKLSLGCLASILASIYVIYLAGSVSHQGGSCPVILRFFGQTLIMAVLSVVFTCVVCRVSSGQRMSTVPPAPKLTLLLTGPLARVLFLQDMASKVGTNFGLEADDEQVVDVASKKPRYEAEWMLVAASLDRIICYAYVIILVISALAYVGPLA